MAFPPSILSGVEYDEEIVDIRVEYNTCINRVFELMGLLENKSLDEVTRGIKEIELKYQQTKARYLSEQWEKSFKK